MTKRVKVAVLGATGAVGQRFIELLENHPVFQVSELVASERSASKTYGEAANWILASPMPKAARDREVRLATDDLDADVCFSAIPSGIAGKVETDLAARGYKVFSNAKDHRMDADVPLIIPEVNPEHAALVERQRTDGFIVTNGNCVGIPLTMALKPLHDKWGVERVNVVSFQAVSGAGYPGVPSLDILGNVIPYIGNEEEKVETEPLKMLGKLGSRGVVPAPIAISATCVRVPVEEGHSLAAHVQLKKKAKSEDVAALMAAWRGRPQELKLPSAPRSPLVVRFEANRPQPRRDILEGNGMAVSVGRVRADPLASVKFFLTSANTIRGAAGCSILNAELFHAEGRL
ncbi:MAG TPA: aspartate-semialdehyde dehydrogenase [Candidatus Thermoplasmatota archaeon]|nr:aspartate-semialdehyde dehydrogenase [Candidatus Thermoplasmatota archaeon]